MLMNYGEVELLLAEASERGLGEVTGSDAQDHYDKGVRASMQMYSNDDPTFTVSNQQVTKYWLVIPMLLQNLL